MFGALARIAAMRPFTHARCSLELDRFIASSKDEIVSCVSLQMRPGSPSFSWGKTYAHDGSSI
jgi:hypothetical protein